MPTSVWDQINSPLLYALPFFVLFIAIEVAAVRHAAREGLRGYEARDARTSMIMGVGSLVFRRGSRSGVAGRLRVPVDLPRAVAPPADTWWTGCC